MKRQIWKLAFLLGFLFAAIFQEEYVSAEELPTTGFEDSNGARWTSYEEELEFLNELDTLSERVRYTQIGTSVEGRPIHLLRIGDPVPASDEEIAAGNNILIMGTQHGNEPSGREMALKIARDLAFTQDKEMLDLLSKTTVLILPTANPDGREADRRINSEGIDMNRDQLELKTTEGQVIAEVLNQFKPDLTLDAHERISGPNLSILGPTNLNVDREILQLNDELVLDYLYKDIETAGFTVGLYDPGTGAARTVRNITGLRHGLGVLVEATWVDEPTVRVEGQMVAAQSILRFYNERFEDVVRVVNSAPERKAEAGARQAAYYLDGDTETQPPDSKILNPAPIGYLLNNQQAQVISRQIELFALETEQVSEHGVFVTMAQPMMTIIPLLMDERSDSSLVDGLAIYDPNQDPGQIDPPPYPEQNQYDTDFSANTPGAPPEDWSVLWRDSGWTVRKHPSRLEHIVTEGSGRRVLTFDQVGEIRGDVEIAGLVRANGSNSTLFQAHLHGGGLAEDESSYYLDLRGKGAGSSSNHVRINRNFDARFEVLGSAKLPFTVEENTWYHVVFQREGTFLRGKVWPYGESEPAGWQIEVEDPFINKGKVGVGHVTTGVRNDWAYFGVGTAGASAPRAPEGIIPDVDKSGLQFRIEEVEAENLNEADFTAESWQNLRNALTSAKAVLEDIEATEEAVNAALQALNQAYDNLLSSPAIYSTHFSQYDSGTVPNDWTMVWRESSWTVKDDPRRLEHIALGSGRKALTWNQAGMVYGDVEVSGLVRASGSGDTLFQQAIQISGDAGSESSYYLDLRTTGYVRINRNLNGAFEVLKSSKIPFKVENDTWYHTVLRREGNVLLGKVWPFGEEEPDEWQIEVVDESLRRGKVGLSHVSTGRTNDWAFFGAGTGGEAAPRAPKGIFVDKKELQQLIDEIKTASLEETHFTQTSWETFQQAFEKAEALQTNFEVNQAEVDEAVLTLTQAFASLQEITIDLIRNQISSFEASGGLNGPVIIQLNNRLDQAEHDYSNDRLDQAVKKIEDFMKHLENNGLQEHISDEAKQSLIQSASELITRWENEYK